MSTSDATPERGILQRLAAGWDRFLFSPLAPTRLAVCRIVYYLALYWLFFIRTSILHPNLLTTSQLPPEFFFPQNVFRYIPIASPATLGTLSFLLQIALLLAAAGFLTRITSVVVFGLLFYLLSTPGMYGKLILIYAIPIIVTGLLALSRSGDALSIDRLIRDRWRHWPLVASDPAPSAHYRWPIQAICIYLVLVYFLAGVSKVVHTGLPWALSDNLSLLLRTNAQNQACLPVGGGGRITELANWLAGHTTITKLLSLGTIVIELGSPLSLCTGIVRYLALLGMAASTVSFYFLVGPDAWPIIAVFCFFLPWEKLVDRFRR